jgi:hypothetical protein
MYAGRHVRESWGVLKRLARKWGDGYYKGIEYPFEFLITDKYAKPF